MRRFELHSVGEPPTGDEGGAALSTPAELRAAIDRLAALCSSPPRVAAELLDKVEGASRAREKAETREVGRERNRSVYLVCAPMYNLHSVGKRTNQSGTLHTRLPNS